MNRDDNNCTVGKLTGVFLKFFEIQSQPGYTLQEAVDANMAMVLMDFRLKDLIKAG